MAKISVVVLADTETHADLGRMLNALELVKEAAASGDQTELGTRASASGSPTDFTS